MTARPGWRPGPGRVHGAAVFLATILAILALAILPLLTPHFIHPAMDAAGSAGRLGVAASVAHRLSDSSVEELVFGPGTFAFDGPAGEPLFDSAERGHLADARLLLWLCLVAGAASLVGMGLSLARARGERRRALWRIVSHAGATTAILVVGLGLISLVAFDSLFTLFHEVFFPGGNWAFDPATQALVQLYPFVFWQVAAAGLGALLLLIGTATWWLGRRLARSTPALMGEDR